MFHHMLVNMFHLELPWLEKILRPVVVFLSLVVMLRFFGKRELAQLNPFDLVVLLSLSNTVQNAIIGDDNSVTGGLIGAFALLGINAIVARAVYQFPKLAAIAVGKETVLLRDGNIDQRALRGEALTEEDLLQAIHKQGFATFRDVSLVQLDPDGTFYVEGKSPTSSDQRLQDILKRVEELHGEMARLQKHLGHGAAEEAAG